MPSGSTINAAGSLLMDGPKKIKAVYELDLTYVSVIVAAIAAIPIALEVVLKRRKDIKKLFHFISKKQERRQADL